MNSATKRPRFLNLRKIKLSLPGIVSILHRVSGVCMILSIPFFLYLLDLSLSSEPGFNSALAYCDTLLFKLAATLILWSLSHHLFAGFRFLLLDLDIGVERSQARHSSIAVFACSIVVTLLLLGVIW